MVLQNFSTIQLKGHQVLVDNEDLAQVNKFKWHVNTNKYVLRTLNAPRINGHRNSKSIALHRFLINAPEGLDVDHINGNPLDNRKSNLRICTTAENLWNSRKCRSASSQYKGVSFNKATKQWEAYINVNSKKIWLGLFTTEVEAATVRDQYTEEYHKAFGRLNLP